MTKAELTTKIAKEAGITKKAAAIALDAIVGAVHASLKKKNGSIRISDLGTFKVIQRKARQGVNPQTGKKIKIAAKKAPSFSAAKALKETARKAK